MTLKISTRKLPIVKIKLVSNKLLLSMAKVENNTKSQIISKQ